MEQYNKWDERFIELTLHIAEWSKDPSTKVGAVIVDDYKTIIGVGYNGFPRGVDDRKPLYINKEEKYPRIVHAELNAILNSGNVRGCTMYVTPLPPCPDCAGAIIQSGIKRVVCSDAGKPNNKWIEKSLISEQMFKECGVIFNKYKSC